MSSDWPPPADVSEHDGVLRIVFPPPVRWHGLEWIPVFLWGGMITFGLIAMACDLPKGMAGMERWEIILFLPFLLFFLSMWLTIGGFGLYRFLFHAAGRELITIDSERLTFRREVPLFTRVRTYPLCEVRSLRATRSLVPFFVSRWSSNSRYACDLFGFTGGVMAFEHEGRTVRVGGGIEESEAEYLVNEIARQFPVLRGEGG